MITHHQPASPPLAGAAGAAGAAAGGVVCAIAAETAINIEARTVANGMRILISPGDAPVYRKAGSSATQLPAGGPSLRKAPPGLETGGALFRVVSAQRSGRQHGTHGQERAPSESYNLVAGLVFKRSRNKPDLPLRWERNRTLTAALHHACRAWGGRGRPSQNGARRGCTGRPVFACAGVTPQPRGDSPAPTARQ